MSSNWMGQVYIRGSEYVLHPAISAWQVYFSKVINNGPFAYQKAGGSWGPGLNSSLGPGPSKSAMAMRHRQLEPSRKMSGATSFFSQPWAWTSVGRDWGIHTHVYIYIIYIYIILCNLIYIYYTYNMLCLDIWWHNLIELFMTFYDCNT